jgi:hypothetical protein
MDDIGGAGERPGLGDGDEGAELIEIEGGGHLVFLGFLPFFGPINSSLKAMLDIRNIRWNDQCPCCTFRVSREPEGP